jgi:multiple sugar transport system substrate-binding protein
MKRIVAAMIMVTMSIAVFAAGGREGTPGGKTTVTMWIYDEMASSAEKAVVRAAREFEAKNPDISIVFENVPNRGLMDKLIVASTAGAVPDVVHVALEWTAELGAMGHASALNDYISPARLKDMPAGALDSSSYRGKIYGAPWYVDTTVLFYNKEMFRAAGLPLPGDEPMNWTQFLQTVKTLTRDLNNDGTTDQFGFGMRKGAGAAICWFPFFFSNGGRLYSADGLSTTVNSPQGHESFRFLTDMFTNGLMPPGAIAYDRWDDIRNAFLSRRLAMYVTGNWEIGPMTAGADFEWGIAPHPMQQSKSSFLGGASLIIPSKAANKEAAWKWIDFLTSAASMKYLAEYDRIPARNDATSADHIKSNPLYAVFAREIPHARSHASIYAGVVRREVGIAFDEVMINKADPTKALNDAAARIQKEMRPDLPGN